MSAAGLTHGGFYGYFKSKEDLIAQTLAEMVKGSEDLRGLNVLEYAATYLTPSTATIRPPAARLPRSAPRPRARRPQCAGQRPGPAGGAFRGRHRRRGRGARAAIDSWAAMVAAVILARLSDEMLRETRAWIEQNVPHAGPVPEASPSVM